MAEKRTIELEIQDNSKTLKQQYKEAVVELQKVAAQYGETSKEAVNAAKAAAELKDKIEDTNDLMKNFKGEGTFIAMNKAMSAVASGFSAVEGGMALIGVEGQAVQETMLKVQAAMALSQGLEGLEDAGRAFTALGTKMKETAVGQAILTAATSAYTFVTSASTAAMKLFRLALISTGIGALVVGLGLLIANFDKVIAVVKSVIGWFGGMDTVREKNHQNDIKRAEAEIKKQEEIRKAREKAFNNEQSEYDRKIKLAEAEGKSTFELEKAKINSSIKYQETKKKELDQELLGLKLMAQQLAFVDEISGGLLTQRIEGLQALLDETDSNIKDQKVALQVLEINNKKAAAGVGGGSGGGGGTNTKKEQIDITRQLEDERLRIKEDGLQKELDAIALQYKRKKEDAEKQLKEGVLKQKDFDTLITQNIESQKIDEAKVTEKYRKLEYEKKQQETAEKIKLEDEQWNELQKLKNSKQEQELLELAQNYDAKFAAAKGNAELEKELIIQQGIETAAIVKKYKDEEEEDQKKRDKEALERKQKLQDNILKASKDTLQVISNLTDLFAGKSKEQQRKAFAVQKAVNISSAVIDTYAAATKALKDGGPTPFNFISMAAAITAGLLNIKKISAQKFDSGNTDSSAPPLPTAATMTPQFNTIGSSGINQLATLQQQPIQAYVVSNDITSAQALDRNRIQNATL